MLGTGSDTVGYWIGTAYDGISKLIVAPKSVENGNLLWGANNYVRGTTSTTNGLANTNTLYSFSSNIGNSNTGHPAAIYCKSLTTGGYNTWYLPAVNELAVCFSRNSVTPFATANALTTAGSGKYYMSSTENTGRYFYIRYGNLSANGGDKSVAGYPVRPFRQL